MNHAMAAHQTLLYTVIKTQRVIEEMAEGTVSVLFLKIYCSNLVISRRESERESKEQQGKCMNLI